MNPIQFMNDLGNKIKMQKTNIHKGKLLTRKLETENSGEVWKQIVAFGGAGWLCATDQSEIRKYHDAGSLTVPADPDNAWILSSENVKGNASLHVTRDGRCWILTFLEEQKTDAEEDVLCETRWLSDDPQQCLLYDVYWSPVNVNGIMELRPVAFRFLGFSAKTEDAK